MFIHTGTRAYIHVHRVIVHRYVILSMTYLSLLLLPIAQEQAEYRWPHNSKYKNDNNFFIVE